MTDFPSLFWALPRFYRVFFVIFGFSLDSIFTASQNMFAIFIAYLNVFI